MYIVFYRVCNSKHSPAELMFNRQMKDNILTIPIHFKSQDLERINHSQDSKYKDLHSGDRVFIFDTDKKVWEKGMIINKTEQPNQYSILFQSGRISNRNRVHLKMDHTPPIVQQQLPTQSPDCVQNDVQPDVDVGTLTLGLTNSIGQNSRTQKFQSPYMERNIPIL